MAPSAERGRLTQDLLTDAVEFVNDEGSIIAPVEAPRKVLRRPEVKTFEGVGPFIAMNRIVQLRIAVLIAKVESERVFGILRPTAEGTPDA